MDNRSMHKVVGVREAIDKAKSRLIYLPPNRLEFKPISQFLAKLKSLVRSAKERAEVDLWNLLGKLFDRHPA